MTVLKDCVEVPNSSNHQYQSSVSNFLAGYVLHRVNGDHSFSKRVSALYEADRRGASNILSPKMISRTDYVQFQLLSP